MRAPFELLHPRHRINRRRKPVRKRIRPFRKNSGRFRPFKLRTPTAHTTRQPHKELCDCYACPATPLSPLFVSPFDANRLELAGIVAATTTWHYLAPLDQSPHMRVIWTKVRVVESTR